MMSLSCAPGCVIGWAKSRDGPKRAVQRGRRMAALRDIAVIASRGIKGRPHGTAIELN